MGTSNRGFCLKRGGLPAGTIAANGGTKLGVQTDRTSMINLSNDPVNKWWDGPDETGENARQRLFIAHPVPFTGGAGNNDQPLPDTGPAINPSPDGPGAGVGFWGSPSAVSPNDTSKYIAIGNNAFRIVTGTPGVFTTDVQVRGWVKSQGFWDNYTGGTVNTTDPQVPAVQL
jgi:hypothetical protein